MSCWQSLTDGAAALVAVGALALLVPAPAAAQAEDPGDFNAAVEDARQVLERGDYQTEWPQGSEGLTGAGGDRKRDPRGRENRGSPRQERQSRESSGFRFSSGTGSAMGMITQVLMWVLIAVVVIILLSMLGSAVMQRRRGQEAARIQEEQLPEEASANRPRPVLAEVEALAAQGQFGPAVHLLLLIALERLVRQRGLVLEDSLTSREILRRLRLGEAGQTALEKLVLGTERFLFAEEMVDRREFDACRQAFEQLEGSAA